MRPFTRRTTGTLAAVLAFGIPAFAAGAVPGAGSEPPATSDSGAGTSCDPDGVGTSFLLEPDGTAAVRGVLVTDISPACAGHAVTVVVAGVVGRAVVSSPRTEVFLERGVPASAVTTLTVAVIPVPTRAGRA